MNTVRVEKINLLINNQDVETESYAEVKDPGRLTDVIGVVAQGTAKHVDEAVQAAHRAFKTWRKTGMDERAGLLRKIIPILQENADPLSLVFSRETGMLPGWLRAEFDYSVNTVLDTIDAAEGFFQPKRVEDESSWVSVEKRPIGVIAGIVPWNAPIVLTIQKVAPALICGNTIVIKPSPTAPLGVSLLLKKIAALFPPGVINVVHGGADVGSALATHPLVRKISFTGGGAIAKHVMRDAADTLKGLHFELGGNDPAIVLDDADVETVVPKIATAAFRRSGQFCYAVKRVYVPQRMYDDFFERMRQAVGDIRIGHPLDESVSMGPVNNANQFKSVSGLIERTKQSGAAVFELGHKTEPDNWDNGYYIMPSLVRNPDPHQEIVACEQFGPILPLIPYRTEEEVIELANQTEYGLGSTIWSSDFERALRLSREIEAGMTFINQNGWSRLGYRHIPWGGVKQSGIGRENSEIGLAEYIEYHAINYHK